jgi:hypothetical protein
LEAQVEVTVRLSPSTDDDDIWFGLEARLGESIDQTSLHARQTLPDLRAAEMNPAPAGASRTYERSDSLRPETFSVREDRIVHGDGKTAYIIRVQPFEMENPRVSTSRITYSALTPRDHWRALYVLPEDFGEPQIDEASLSVEFVNGPNLVADSLLVLVVKSPALSGARPQDQARSAEHKPTTISIVHENQYDEAGLEFRRVPTGN